MSLVSRLSYSCTQGVSGGYIHLDSTRRSVFRDTLKIIIKLGSLLSVNWENQTIVQLTTLDLAFSSGASHSLSIT